MLMRVWILIVPFLAATNAFAQQTVLVSSVLPTSRSVTVGHTATAFATIINAGSVPATGCSIAPSNFALSATLPASFTYQITDPATNALTGAVNVPVTIAAGVAQSFVFAITPTAAFSPSDVTLDFSCANAEPAAVTSGLNSLLLSAVSGSGPDIIALAATTTNNGIAAIPGLNGTGFFAVATSNIGAAGQITVTSDTGNAPLPVALTVCQTNSATGACLSPPSPTVTTTMASGATPTFSVFVAASGAVPSDPARHRAFLRFQNAAGQTLGATSVAIQNTTYSGPLTINSGGTYSGNWESQDPAVPAVTVNTTAPVIIQNCFIRGKSHLILAVLANTHVTVQNCRGYGLDPLVAGQQRGDFYHSYQIGSLTFQHNYLEATNFGVQIFTPAGWVPNGPIVILYNRARNLDGLKSDGQGGRVLTNLAEPDDNQNHFVILAGLQNLTGTQIAWNEVISDPYVSSMGDTIDIYSTSGTASSPIDIHDNYLLGAYPAHPTYNPYYGGGITMDGTAADTAATATAFVNIHDNQIVARSNFGIGLAAGHDNAAYANRIVTSGQLSNGLWYDGYTGIYVIDCGCYNQPPSVYFNNSAHDNIVGFQFENASGLSTYSPPTVRQDYILTDCAGGTSGPSSKCTNNVSLPDPITAATEANETVLWHQKLSNNAITVGPQ